MLRPHRLGLRVPMRVVGVLSGQTLGSSIRARPSISTPMLAVKNKLPPTHTCIQPSTANGTDTSRIDRLERGMSGTKQIVHIAMIHDISVNTVPIRYLFQLLVSTSNPMKPAIEYGPVDLFGKVDIRRGSTHEVRHAARIHEVVYSCVGGGKLATSSSARWGVFRDFRATHHVWMCSPLQPSQELVAHVRVQT
jgi:hypothetical protein